jgi:hypothetical protein
MGFLPVTTLIVKQKFAIILSTRSQSSRSTGPENGIVIEQQIQELKQSLDQESGSLTR